MHPNTNKAEKHQRKRQKIKALKKLEQFEVYGYPWIRHDSLQSVNELVESASADIDVTLCKKCLVDEPLVCRTVFGGNILYLNCECLLDEAKRAKMRVLIDEHSALHF